MQLFDLLSRIPVLVYDQRFDISRNKNIEGTGLGMNISRQLLKLMGSELQIESEYEKGSEFSFELVQKVVDEKPLGDYREREIQVDEKAKKANSFTAPDAKVLIVDDNKMNVKVFQSLLKKTQMQISEAFSGKECLEILKEKSFDIIFLDHMMPGMDGIETLHVIKEENLCEDVPIIMLTANAIVGDRERYLEEGFDDFLTKPIITDELDRIILQHIPEKISW